MRSNARSRSRWYSQRRKPWLLPTNPSIPPDTAERELRELAERCKARGLMKDYFEAMAEVGRIREQRAGAR